MNKFLRKAMALALAGTMTLGMGVTTFATDSNLNTSQTASDTPTINLLKDYINGSENQQNTKSPKETFTFTVDRNGLWNVGEDGKGNAKYNKNNMPTFSNGESTGETNTFTIDVAEGKAGTAAKGELFTKLSVPDYEAVGDYWYSVTETDNNVAGVIYGTNDSKKENLESANGAHNAIYYIHVQVTNATTKGQYIRTVTLHKDAPGAGVDTNAAYEEWYAKNNENTNGQTDKKVNDIQNKYYAGSLKITKEVTGNAGDKNELFHVTVVFKNDSGASMNSDITYKNFYDAKGNLTDKETILEWKDPLIESGHTKEEFSQDFYVKDGTTVTFDNIPYGVSYTVTEERPADDKYTHSFTYTNNSNNNAGKFNGIDTDIDTVETENANETGDAKWKTAQATGSISDDLDEITITNTKESVIDIGVITSNAPYVAILVFAVAAMALYIRRRKDMIEE